MTTHDATEQAYKNGYIDALNQLKAEIKTLKADVGCMFWGGEYGFNSAISAVEKTANTLMERTEKKNV